MQELKRKGEMEDLYNFILKHNLRQAQTNAVLFGVVVALFAAYVSFVSRYMIWDNMTTDMRLIFITLFFHVVIAFLFLAVSIFQYRTIQQTPFIALLLSESKIIVRANRPFFSELTEDDSQTVMDFCINEAKKDSELKPQIKFKMFDTKQ